MSLMMFIGASPSSTGGGVRTTTFGIVLLFVYRMAIGHETIKIFKRRLPQVTIVKALVTVMLGFIINSVASVIMMLSEQSTLIPVMFEVASAFGTTGLSMGITGDLSVIGRLVIILVMFIGQIGITTIILIFSSEKKPKEHYTYPQENILIG
jgi:Trk-type K+ transport system membrane component